VIDAIGAFVFRLARAIRRPFQKGPGSAERDSVRRILLIQLDHLGDAIISTVMLPLLRARYPRAEIEVLAAPWNRQVFDAMPEVDRVHVSPVNRFVRAGGIAWVFSTFVWGFRLRRRRIDLGIDVRGEFPHALILWLSGAPRRLGWNCGGGGFLLTDSASYVAGRPEIASRLALLARLGIRPGPGQSPLPAFRPSDSACREIARRLAAVELPGSGGGPRIVMHIGAGTCAKRWPDGHWDSLIAKVSKRLEAQIILVGDDRKERAAGKAILRRGPQGRLLDWTGKLSVDQLAALLKQSELLVGTDSGPAHMAAAVGTPVVSLSSGTNNPRQWRPGGRRVTVLRNPVPCSPCHRRKCPFDDHPCMNGLGPDRVFGAIERALDQVPITAGGLQR
jgi:heptosyltransferase-2